MTDLGSRWRAPRCDSSLASDDVHVWRASLQQPAECVDELAQTLSRDELTRAERFRFEQDRRRFIVGRGVLRAILGRYLDVEPYQLQFCYGVHGKPYLPVLKDAEPILKDAEPILKDAEPNGFGNYTLQFNMAHSHELALYVFTRDRRIGVDVEYLRPIPDMRQIARRFFSARENATLEMLPMSQELGAFYNCWTRKEAYLKAIGLGLTSPLDQFDVSLAPGKSARLLHIEGDAREIERWSFHSLTPDFGYVAAVAVEGYSGHLVYWQWS
jgi:4'-phosphopantetheinyl transferase